MLPFDIFDDSIHQSVTNGANYYENSPHGLTEKNTLPNANIHDNSTKATEGRQSYNNRMAGKYRHRIINIHFKTVNGQCMYNLNTPHLANPGNMR